MVEISTTDRKENVSTEFLIRRFLPKIQLPLNMPLLAKGMGINVNHRSINGHRAAIFSKDRTIFLENRLNDAERRFYIAHGIGHHLLGHGTCFDNDKSINRKNQNEMAANVIAFDFLVPEFLMARHGRFSTAESLAGVFGVQKEIIEFQIDRFNGLNPEMPELNPHLVPDSPGRNPLVKRR